LKLNVNPLPNAVVQMNPITAVLQALAANPASLSQQIQSTVLRVNNFNITLMADVSTPAYTIPALGGSIQLANGAGDFRVGIGLSQAAAGPLTLDGLVAVCLTLLEYICVYGAACWRAVVGLVCESWGRSVNRRC
jgi:hypothetical protein